MTQVRRFTGATPNDANKAAEAEMGLDPVIMNQKRLPDGGYEVYVMTRADFEMMQKGAEIAPKGMFDAPQVPVEATTEDAPVALAAPAEVPNIFEALDKVPVVELDDYMTRRLVQDGQRLEESQQVLVEAVAEAPVAEAEVLEAVEVVTDEVASMTNDMRFDQDIMKSQAICDWTVRSLADMQSMHDIIRRQLLPRVAESSIFADAHRHLTAVGIAPAMIPSLIDNLPDRMMTGLAKPDEFRQWLINAVADKLPVMASSEIWSDQRKVIAFVGSPGVGKSSTVAKLASRFALKNSVSEVVVITLDSSNHDLLKNQCELLGVDFTIVEEHQSLAERLAKLSHKRLVLIDTVGLGYRDKRLAAGFSRLTMKGEKVTPVLVMSADQDVAALNAMVSAYSKAAAFAGTSIQDCMITKLDQAVKLGGMLSAISGSHMRLSYQSGGRDVMDDFEKSMAAELVNAAFDLVDDELEIKPIFGQDERGQRFEALRSSIMDNIGNMIEELTQVRREMRNAGYEMSTRLVTGSQKTRIAEPVAETITVQARSDVDGRRGQLMWCVNDADVTLKSNLLAIPGKLSQGLGHVVLAESVEGEGALRLK
ncbi:flagellar biosynthesis GTPase FlhF [Pseudomonas nitritireducens]|uniref:Flagellar biosynthesis GTPase FlhF n=1 Tax=Pseudomonas nitroreducens TaxID=46680 RepID=A0A7W7KNK9_PSENT|nr:GTPase [Pseudomonas nitritireducens]MBB4865413.1 flagellar biosynthesis GTPase FlhF [Pseudomonas nitritireducens]